MICEYERGNMDKLLGTKEVMEKLGVGKYTATNIIKAAGPVNKGYRQKLLISESALERYLEGAK